MVSQAHCKYHLFIHSEVIYIHAHKERLTLPISAIAKFPHRQFLTTKIAVMDVNLPTEIPDDIFQAALAASLQESDGEDPFGRQPKVFMLTTHQIKERKRNLEISQIACTIRKMRSAHKRLRQLMKRQKWRPSPFETLPNELIVHLMRHTHIDSLTDLVNSSKFNKNIFKAHKAAIYRGMEIEQFSQWKWLCGDSAHRSPAQSQRLKDIVGGQLFFGRPAKGEWFFHILQLTGRPAKERFFFEIVRLIDNNQFTGEQYVHFLQNTQEGLNSDIEAIESYTSMRVAVRTAICLRSLYFERAVTVKGEDGSEPRIRIEFVVVPWEEYSQLIGEQPARIQDEIRSVLESVIRKIYLKLEYQLYKWARRYFCTPGVHRKPQEVKEWMSKLMTGLILEEVTPLWRATIDAKPTLALASRESSVAMHMLLARLLNRHNEGHVDVLQEVKKGTNFGRSIGLEVGKLVDETETGFYIDTFEPTNDSAA